MASAMRVSGAISVSDMTNEFVTSQLVVMVINLVWLVMKGDSFCQILKARPLQAGSRQCLIKCFIYIEGYYRTVLSNVCNLL